MKIPFDKLAGAVKLGAEAKRDSDTPVRVAVYVDDSATDFLVGTIRRALVPETTSGLVRVGRLSASAPVKPDTDVVLVLSCGSSRLEESIRSLVVFGAPVAVVCESSVEAPFIREDTPMLGLVAATDSEHLLSSLASWILARTDKRTAFAANFAFMRSKVSEDLIAKSALGNAATGAVAFIPGADFPVMTLTEVGMMLQLAAAHGRPMNHERAYDALGVLVVALAARTLARKVSPAFGRLAFVPKCLIAGAGTAALGAGLNALYGSDFDYARIDGAVKAAASAATRRFVPDPVPSAETVQ